MSLGGVFKIFALLGFMGALFSRRRKSAILVHFSDKPASLKICQSDGSVSTESLESLVETRYAVGDLASSIAYQIVFC